MAGADSGRPLLACTAKLTGVGAFVKVSGGWALWERQGSPRCAPLDEEETREGVEKEAGAEEEAELTLGTEARSADDFSCE